jgi:Tol biopolymer transport system component
VTTNKGGALNLPEADAVDMTGSLDQAGSRLLFSSLRRPGPPGWNLFVVDVPTGSYRELPGLNSDEDDRMPAWSGDGRWLVYAASRPTGAGLQDLYLYDTLEKRHVTLPGLNSPSRETEPAISGDGRWIAFVSTRPADRNAPAGTGDLNVYLYDRSAAALVLLPGLNGPGSDQSPSVSPDGRFIAFVSERFGNAGARDIYVHDRSTRRLVPTGAVNSDRDDFDPSLAYLPAGPD